MEKPFKVFYVKEFPIDQLTLSYHEGWHVMPNHRRHHYQFLEAILEHIDNTFCEPIQVTLRNEREISAGPSGVSRLFALHQLRGWTTIPAIVSALITPDWLDTSTPVTSLEQYRSYYRLEPGTYGFEENGKAYHHNQNPNPTQLKETFVVSEETKQRILAMLEMESHL